MSNEEEMIVEKSSTHIITVGNPSRSVARSALFLLPRADRTRLPALPSQARNGGLVRDDELHMDFRGWVGSPTLWKEWVAKIRPQHERLWRRVGIFDAILATTRRLRRHEDLLLQLSAFWSRDTSTFVFPWGEATVTLEDVAVLGGLPLSGDPACAVLPYALCGDMDALKAIRSTLNRSKRKKAQYSAWVKYFLERPPEEDAAGDEDRLVEHAAFLAMWLSVYVFPSPPFGVVQARLFPIAIRLARDQRVALAAAALASIYNSLSSPATARAGCAPIHILQLWVWERFQELRPEAGSSPGPNGNDGVPARAARWHNVRKTSLSPRYIRAVFMSPKKFEWMPYGASPFGLPPGNGGRHVHGQDIAGSQELLSMAQCLRPCELVGIDCIEQYCPHRVARQLGFDQDVPGNVPRANSDPQAAWATYKVEPTSLAFIVPHGDPGGVTVEYERWWKPRSSDVAEVARSPMSTTEGVAAATAAAAEDDIPPPKESLNNGEAIDLNSTLQEEIIVISDDDDESGEEESGKKVKVAKLVASASSDTGEPSEGRQLLSSGSSSSSTINDVQVIPQVSMETNSGRTGHGYDELLAAAPNDGASREEPDDDMPPSNPVEGKTAEPVVCTRTIYYLAPFPFEWRKKMSSAGGTSLDQGVFQPRREEGTREMILQADAAQEAERAELVKQIDSIKKQIWG